MRVLQIGAGRWGRNHIRSWKRLGVDLCVFDTDARALAELDVAPVSSVANAMDRIDAVDIATPAPTHGALARQALEAGKDVFVEKPLTVGSDEGFELATLARMRGSILQVGHLFRFAPEVRMLKRILECGAVGRVLYVQGKFGSFKRPRPDGGAALSDGVHWVDLASWLLGEQPHAVQAVLRDTLGRGLDDVALLTLAYGNALVQLEVDCHLPEQRRDLTLMASEGALTCDFLAKGIKLHLYRGGHEQGEAGAWEAPIRKREALPTDPGEPLLDELAAFLDACSTRTPSSVAAGGYAGAAAVSVIEACELASREGRRVEVRLPIPSREPNRE